LKKLRTRLVSAFLVIMTLLTLLPTSALAASSTGTGIKPTSNTNYWTTRLLHDGTPYSYKPPMAAGKMLYCLDRGYGYRWGTPSFLNSYTYTSATGADADAVLKTALAQSGMGELDAQQLENFKWMMSFIVDYKGDIPGSLFMAAQTYVWDHQTFKGEGDGDIDGGGYANADTYEMYLGYIDWMLKEKAKEDAEFQRQIEEYAEQGIIATVVEDEAAKWAVYAKSSVKGRQAFFNYYAPRKLAVNTPKPDPDNPPAGDADITLKKVAAGTTQGLDGAKFNIYRDGQIVGSDVTKNGGIIEVKDVTKGLWSFVETEAPEGYCADSTPISVYYDIAAIGYLHAVQRYFTEKSLHRYRFSTIAWRSMNSSLNTFRRQEQRRQSHEFSYQAAHPPPDDAFDALRARLLLHDLFLLADEEQALLIRHRLHGCSLTETARMEGMSVKRVRHRLKALYRAYFAQKETKQKEL